MRVHAPLASTKSKVSAPIASRAIRTRSTSRFGSRPTFIFTAEKPLLGPPAELFHERGVVVRREPAAAVEHDRGARAAEERGERHAEKLRLEVPKRDVDRGDRLPAEAGTTEVSHGVVHRHVRRRRRHRVEAFDRGSERLLDDARRGGVGVRPAEALDVAGLDAHQDHRGCCPTRSFRRTRAGRSDW